MQEELIGAGGLPSYSQLHAALVGETCSWGSSQALCALLSFMKQSVPRRLLTTVVVESMLFAHGVQLRVCARGKLRARASTTRDGVLYLGRHGLGKACTGLPNMLCMWTCVSCVVSNAFGKATMCGMLG